MYIWLKQIRAMEKSKKPLSDRLPLYALIWVLSYIGSLGALKMLSLPEEFEVILTIVPALAFALFLYTFYRYVHLMDEVQIKIRMEAAVVAFSLALVTVMTLGLVDIAFKLNGEDWNFRFLAPMFMAYYLIGLVISKRKYNIDHEEHD
jgi:membrane-associated HD superfamily phosphohydrolase